MTMDGDAVFDMRRRQEWRLIKAFFRITDPSKRRRILKLAEQLADDAAREAAGLALAATDASPDEASREVPGRTE
jgi:hypothetical protein